MQFVVKVCIIAFPSLLDPDRKEGAPREAVMTKQSKELER